MALHLLRPRAHTHTHTKLDSDAQATWSVPGAGYSCPVPVPRRPSRHRTARSRCPRKAQRAPAHPRCLGPYSGSQEKYACPKLLGAGVVGTCCPGTGVAGGRPITTSTPQRRLPSGGQVQPGREPVTPVTNRKTQDAPACKVKLHAFASWEDLRQLTGKP